jgi:adenylate kinase
VKLESILLIGPTGSGKTPLGDLMSANGLWGRQCHHFDFGARLRGVAKLQPGDELFSDQEIALVKTVLSGGALLEDQQFFLAEKILNSFLQKSGARAEDLLVLNGLPRHVGQAAAMDALVDIRHVISLSCTPETVYARIKADSGGDRSRRIDDDLEAVGRKLQIFSERTSPLLLHYSRAGATIHEVQVGVTTTADHVIAGINK